MNAARASLLALLLCWASVALAVVAVPPLVGRVVDQTGTLSSGDIASLNQTIRAFEARKGSQIAVMIAPTTDGEAIEQFSLRVAEAWKIGRKKVDDGAVLVIAKNDRHLRIEVGYGLEGALTDVTTKRIIDEEITPKFKTGDFAGGVSAGIGRIIRVIDGEKLPAPEPPHWQGSGLFDITDIFNPFLLIPVLLFGGVMRTLLGRLAGSAVGGGLATLIAWYLFGSLLAGAIAGVITSLFVMFGEAITAPTPGRRGSGGGWSGGSSGGSWSSGGSSSSSSSSDSGGGGGSFGGGGASGSW
ncbi:MAG: TPM domain-containing protein [Bradyrhizobium sp.]|nr:TPM domain-containing protein [Bradyrhizobium sp.]